MTTSSPGQNQDMTEDIMTRSGHVTTFDWAARLLDEVVSKSKMDKTYKKKAEIHLIDTISLIAYANNTVNFQCREAIKKKLPPNYGMALTQPEEASATLFGDDCAEKLKKAGLSRCIYMDYCIYFSTP